MSLPIYLLQASLIMGVLTLSYWFLLRRATWFELNRYLLWFNVVLSLGLPLVELPDFRPEPVRQLVQKTLPALPQLQAATPPVVLRQPINDFPGAHLDMRAPSVDQSINWLVVLGWLYAVGVGLLGLHFLLQLTSLTRLITRSEKEREEDVWLVENEAVSSPFSFFHWIVIDSNRYDPDELAQILAHERVHCRQWHSLDILTSEMLRIVFWINPFVWWHQRLVQENLEYLVDREVLEEGVDRKAYQYHLLKASFSANSKPKALANSFNSHRIKQRIAMMNRRFSNYSTWGYGGVLLAMLGTATLAIGSGNVKKSTVTLLTSPRETLQKTADKREEPAEKVLTEEPTGLAFPAVDSSQHESVLDEVVNKPELVTIADSVASGQAKKAPVRQLFKRQGDRLYWVVTPNITLDDLMALRQEAKQFGYTFDLSEIRYDPLNHYVTRAKVSMKRSGYCEIDDGSQTSITMKPIASMGGYIGTKGECGIGPVAELKLFSLPSELAVQVAADEQEVTDWIKAHKMNYLIYEGEKSIGQGEGYGSSSASGDVLRNNPKLRNSNLGVYIDDAGKLAPYDKPAAYYINNQPVNVEAVRSINLEKLHAVVTKSTSKGIDRHVLLYVNE
ncbi:M56 family metallopeptidase [Tellurirhabdus bombi]|uniref:M56 family metallopeptidase n=1 Tax=Tellurirhabdus bombi TaxID=2907205 RepID=UPI001F4584FB|nr:M56 family metallopeptidase [Tellurirhabdus bombi]